MRDNGQKPVRFDGSQPILRVESMEAGLRFYMLEIFRVGREVACQPVLFEVGPGAHHIHLFPGRKLSTNPIEGGSAGFDVPAEPQFKYSDEIVAL
jgi:hypothetical protein